MTAVLEVERTGSVQGGEVVTQAGRAGWEGASPPPRPEAEILRPYFGVLSDTGRSKLMAGMRAVGACAARIGGVGPLRWKRVRVHSDTFTHSYTHALAHALTR